MVEEVKFFHTEIQNTGWKKNMSQKARRALMLKAHKGNALATAHAMRGLANVTRDKKTAMEADKDADYFYDLNRGQRLKTTLVPRAEKVEIGRKTYYRVNSALTRAGVSHQMRIYNKNGWDIKVVPMKIGYALFGRPPESKELLNNEKPMNRNYLQEAISKNRGSSTNTPKLLESRTPNLQYRGVLSSGRGRASAIRPNPSSRPLGDIRITNMGRGNKVISRHPVRRRHRHY